MATNINSDGGGNSGIAFIVGGLVVVVAAIGFAMAGGIWPFDRAGDVNVKIEQPAGSTDTAPSTDAAPATGGSDTGSTASGSGSSTTTTTTTN